MVTLRVGRSLRSPLTVPMVKLPAGTRTMTGHSAQSWKLIPSPLVRVLEGSAAATVAGDGIVLWADAAACRVVDAAGPATAVATGGMEMGVAGPTTDAEVGSVDLATGAAAAAGAGTAEPARRSCASAAKGL